MLRAAEKYWGDEKYKMVKTLGYSAVDFNMADTDMRLYSAGEDEFKLFQSVVARLLSSTAAAGSGSAATASAIRV